VLACFLTRLVVAWKQVVFVLPSLIAMCDASFFFHLFSGYTISSISVITVILSTSKL
jgi:hypothetical protein